LERWLHYHPTKTAGSGVIQITSNDDSVSSTRAVTRRGITATTGSFASISHTIRDLALKIPRRQLQICSLTRRGVSARQRQASARLARWLLSSKHTQQDCSAAHALRLGAVGSWQCALARSASPFITSSAAVCFTSPLVLHFTSPTLRQQRLRARTSCQERISSESTQPSTPAYSIIKAKHLRHPLSHPLIVSASAQTTVILVRQACLTHHSPSTTASILPCNDYCLLLRVRRCAAPLQISLTRHISTNLSLRHFTHTSVSLRLAQCRFSHSNTRPSGLRSTTALFDEDRAQTDRHTACQHFHHPTTNTSRPLQTSSTRTLTINHGRQTRFPEDSRERGSRPQ
jgi:hypothetical protein